MTISRFQDGMLCQSLQELSRAVEQVVYHEIWHWTLVRLSNDLSGNPVEKVSTAIHLLSDKETPMVMFGDTHLDIIVGLREYIQSYYEVPSFDIASTDTLQKVSCRVFQRVLVQHAFRLDRAEICAGPCAPVTPWTVT